MTGRERNERVKRICKAALGYRPRVTCGTGTARSWVTVHLTGPIDPDIRELICNALVAEKPAGTYYTDSGVNDYEAPCVGFRGPRSVVL